MIPTVQTVSWSNCPECTIGPQANPECPTGPQANPDRWLEPYQTFASVTRPNNLGRNLVLHDPVLWERKHSYHFPACALVFFLLFSVLIPFILCVCVQMWVCVPRVCKYEWRPEEGVIALGVCEAPHECSLHRNHLSSHLLSLISQSKQSWPMMKVSQAWGDEPRVAPGHQALAQLTLRPPASSWEIGGDNHLPLQRSKKLPQATQWLHDV